MPEFAHVPLIHGADGAKLSKRHGAHGVEEYRDMGYLPVALRNYLVRLGWSHGDDEIMSTEDLIRWFDIDDIDKSAARLDFKSSRISMAITSAPRRTRLCELDASGSRTFPASSARPMRLARSSGSCRVSTARLADLFAPKAGRSSPAIPILKERLEDARGTVGGAGYHRRRAALEMDDKAAKLLDAEGASRSGALLPKLQAADHWHGGAARGRR